jgi:cytoskeletal protein RodZ
MAQETPEGVGRRLKAYREKQGISLRDIAAATKIAPGALDAIERDDIRRLPGGIFMRAFVRAYASELELNPNQTLREFLAQFPQIQQGEDSAAAAESSDARELQMGPALRMLGRAGVLMLPLALVVLWVVLFPRHGEPQPLAGGPLAAARADVLPPTAISRVIDAVPDSAGAEALPAVRESGPLHVALSVTGDCWVQLTADGRPAVERLLRAGESVEVSASRGTVIKVGDAGAVSLRVNGEAGRPLGARGQVVTTRIDQSNYRDFLMAP